MAKNVALSGFQISRIGPIVLCFFAILAFFISINLFVSWVSESNPPSTVLLFVCAGGTGLLVIAGFAPFLKSLLPRTLHHPVNFIHAFTIDIFAKLLFILLFPYRQTRFDPKAEEVTDQVPILLIHGYLENSAAWIYHRYHYHRAGLSNIFTVDLGYPFDSIESYAEKVRERVRHIKALTGKNEIVLVGHSMGGLVAAYYIVHIASQEGMTVRDLITLGSPLEGTVTSIFGVGKCTKQMRRNSAFLHELIPLLVKSSTRCFCQGSRADLIVFPGLSATPVNRGFYKLAIYDDLGHVSFLFSDAVISSNISYLYRS